MKKPDSIIEIFLDPGDFYFGDRNTRLRTTLGSCVSITMWHPHYLIGGMCHYMLAASTDDDPNRVLNGKYGEDALQMFFNEARKAGTYPNEYQYKIFGGGNMFPKQSGKEVCAIETCHTPPSSCRNVSCKNANSGRAMLKRHGLKVSGEHLGGTGHRNIIFDIWSGYAWVRQSPISTFPIMEIAE